MKAVITVIGHDQIGIVAKVSQRLATLKVNITDISQTLMHGDVQFEVVKQGLQDLANETGLSINIQRQELFDAIQKL